LPTATQTASLKLLAIRRQQKKLRRCFLGDAKTCRNSPTAKETASLAFLAALKPVAIRRQQRKLCVARFLSDAKTYRNSPIAKETLRRSLS
jgi:hypothetical protein